MQPEIPGLEGSPTLAKVRDRIRRTKIGIPSGTNTRRATIGLATSKLCVYVLSFDVSRELLNAC